jgi:hypothetical protein
MRLRLTFAVALAAGAIGFLPVTASEACNEPACGKPTVVAQGKPLQLTEQPAAARGTSRKPRRTPERPGTKASQAETPAAVAGTTPQAAVPSGGGDDTPLPAVVVRTTREPADPSNQVASGEFSETDLAASAASLLLSTITNYLGGRAAPEAFDAGPNIEVQGFPVDARNAYAADRPPQQPGQVALEYILMTFGGALAAAAAIRVFVI